MPIWYILSFGITRRVWLYRVNKELDGHAALALNHRLNLFLLLLPFLGPTIVTYQTTKRCNSDLHSGAPIKYGPTFPLWLGTLVWILGPAAHMVWTQDRLNRYWQHERDNRDHGIDLSTGQENDPRFVATLSKAIEDSRHAGSRFDRKKDARRERFRRATADIRETALERKQVRAAGGSTPFLPWLRPERPTPRHLDVNCGRCEMDFRATQDPFAETTLLCPRCGLLEVLPSLRGDGLGRKETKGVAAIEVDCPKCKTHFHAVRDLYGPSAVTCYECGKTERLPAPKVKVVKS